MWNRFVRYATRTCGLQWPTTDMASSYVEVRESENGTEGSMLQFEINPCESNGIDVPSHIDGEPPKDHTYNKDPEVVQESIPGSTSLEADQPIEKKEGNNEGSRKSSRNIKSTKQKTAKVHSGEKTKSHSKKDATKKASRKKVPVEKEEEEQPKIDEKIVNAEKTNEESSSKIEDAENVSPVAIPTKKKNRKRKAEENTKEEVDAKQSKTTLDSVPEKVELNEDNTEEKQEPEKEKEQKTEKKIKQPKEKPQKPTKALKTIKNVKKEKEEETPKPPMKLKTAPGKKGKDTGEHDASLPEGWTRKLVERKSGKTAGLIDIYIYSPEGIKFRSRPDIAAYLAKIKSNLKVEDFNFTKRGLVGSTAKTPVNKKRPSNKGEEKSSTKIASKQKKKTNSGSSTGGKKGHKLLVKLNVNTAKKRILSDNENQKGEKKSKPEESKPAVQKGTGGSRRKK